MENEVKKRTAVKKAEKPIFVVKTKGYKESFDTLDNARNQSEILKKRAIKKQAPVKIKIFEQVKGKTPELIDEVSISGCYYDED